MILGKETNKQMNGPDRKMIRTKEDLSFVGENTMQHTDDIL